MREWIAFVAVPLIGTAIWYVVTLAHLAIANGRLRWTTDVVAFGIGAVLIALPTFVAATVLLAVAAYIVVRATVGVRLESVLVGGAAGGLVAALFFWVYAHEWSAISPVRGCIIGVATAWAWWRLAGRPSQRPKTVG